jgi:hypothetical protein
MFVVMALVTTFATTPLTSALYPPWYQKKLEAWKRGEIDWDTGKPTGAVSADTTSTPDSLLYEMMEASKVKKMLVYLRLDNMPTILAFMSLLGGTPQQTTRVHPVNQSNNESEVQDNVQATANATKKPRRPIEAHGVRLVELTERDSSVMLASELEEYSMHDPLVNTFRTFGNLHNLAVSGDVVVLPESSFADALMAKASNLTSDLLLLPWSETGSMSETAFISAAANSSKLSVPSFTTFVLNTLNDAPCTTAVFISRNFGGTTTNSALPALIRSKSALSMNSVKGGLTQPTAPVADRSHHIFCPFFGGADDRAALHLVLQMAENPEVTATIVFFEVNEKYFVISSSTIHDDMLVRSPTAGSSKASEMKKGGTFETKESEVLPKEKDVVFFASLKNSLPAGLASRILFETVQTEMEPLKACLERAAIEVGRAPRNAGDLVVVGRNAARVASFVKEVRGTSDDDVLKCLGVIGAEATRSGVKASVVVVQAGESQDPRWSI